jgi:hypothetical protein
MIASVARETKIHRGKEKKETKKMKALRKFTGNLGQY